MTYPNFYFHIGLYDLATNYLQRAIFRRWNGIKYLPDRNISHILRQPEGEKCLISSEHLSGATFATLEERCQRISKLARMFPGVNTLIGLRQHGGHVASLYSQYIRHGGNKSFDGFFSLTGPQREAVWCGEDLSFKVLIETTEIAFGKQPFVFLLDELQHDAEDLLSDLANFFDEPQPGNISPFTLNADLGGWQGQLLRKVNNFTGVSYSPTARHRPYSKLRRWHLDPSTLCHRILGRLPSGPLVSKEQRDEINRAYKADWRFVCDYLERSPYRQCVKLAHDK